MKTLAELYTEPLVRSYSCEYDAEDCAYYQSGECTIVNEIDCPNLPINQEVGDGK